MPSRERVGRGIVGVRKVREGGEKGEIERIEGRDSERGVGKLRDRERGWR